MNNGRITDLVARISHVNLQSTSKVIKALALASKVFEQEQSPKLTSLSEQLEMLIRQAELNDDVGYRDIRTFPSIKDCQDCDQNYRHLKKAYPIEFQDLRHWTQKGSPNKSYRAV